MNGGPWLALVAVGLAVLAVLASVSSAASATRELDEATTARPPLAWRIAWPLVRALARWPGAMLANGPTRRRTATLLMRAGLDQALTPEHFVAGRLLLAALLGALAALALLPAGGSSWLAGPVALILGWTLPATWLRDRVMRKTLRIERELPFFLDVLTLALEAGLNLTGALHQAIDKGPAGPLRSELMRTMRDLRAGRGRADALRALAQRVGTASAGSLVSALLSAEKQGASLGAVLRAQAEQRRGERYLRAEKLAMEAPVKMLFPLLLFIFPCTFLVLFYPIVARVIQEGLLR